MRTEELRKQVTADIVAKLKDGVAAWVKPWKDGHGNGLPINGTSGRPYHGINVLILWIAAAKQGFASNEWMTYKQATDRGAHVRKGEKSTFVGLYKPWVVDGDDGEEETRVVLRAYAVFNREQIEGLPEEAQETVGSVEDRYPTAHAYIGATGASITHDGDRACYIPSADMIRLPERGAFKTEGNYLGTATHELVHWTGAEKRLNRQLRNRFGDAAYAAEELIAELGSAFLCAQLGIEGKLQHAEYIGYWITLLEHDDKAIFTAAGKASAAVRYLNDLTGSAEELDEAA